MSEIITTEYKTLLSDIKRRIFDAQYQALKARVPLKELFRNPELAGAITLQPLEIIGVDAAILFADIMTMPSGMGFDIDCVDGK